MPSVPTRIPTFRRKPGSRYHVAAIRSYDMVFGVGPAGTGKTYLAVACAVTALETGRSSRIVVIVSRSFAASTS